MTYLYFSMACLGVVGTEWERDGNGVGVGTGTPFRDKPPPPPPVVSKGCVESGEFNKRATSRQPGGGGGAYLERVC